MNRVLNNIVFNEKIHLNNGNFLQALTLLQKRVALVAAVIFSCLLIYCLASRCGLKDMLLGMGKVDDVDQTGSVKRPGAKTIKLGLGEVDVANKKVTLTKHFTSGIHDHDYYSFYKEALTYFPKDSYLKYDIGFGVDNYLYYNEQGEIKAVLSASMNSWSLKPDPSDEAKIKEIKSRLIKIDVDESVRIRP